MACAISTTLYTLLRISRRLKRFTYWLELPLPRGERPDVFAARNRLNSDNHSCRSVDTMVWYPGGARLITDQQVVLLRQRLMEGKTPQSTAATAAMSERSARKWQRGELPSDSKKARRRWRSRPDLFEDVWESDVVPLLLTDSDGELSATTILEWLDERHPGRFGRSQLRTLQRRMRDYRALHGPDRGECPDLYSHCTPLFSGRPSCIPVHQPLKSYPDESQHRQQGQADSTSRSLTYQLSDSLSLFPIVCHWFVLLILCQVESALPFEDRSLSALPVVPEPAARPLCSGPAAG